MPDIHYVLQLQAKRVGAPACTEHVKEAGADRSGHVDGMAGMYLSLLAANSAASVGGPTYCTLPASKARRRSMEPADMPRLMGMTTSAKDFRCSANACTHVAQTDANRQAISQRHARALGRVEQGKCLKLPWQND